MALPSAPLSATNLAASVRKCTALDYREQALLVPVQRLSFIEPLNASVQPPLGKPQTLLGICVVALARRALVKSHHDVGPDDTLGIHDILGSEEVLRAIYVRPELAALFTQLADAGQREDLKAPTVSQNGSLPAVKAGLPGNLL